MTNVPNDSSVIDHPGPPLRSPGILSDIKTFFMSKPSISTLVHFGSASERENYSQRILQRLGISVTKYAILNIHKIGISAPVRYVFEELLSWDGDSTYWPNRIAAVERVDGRLEQIRIHLLGRNPLPSFLESGHFGLNLNPLFNLTAIRFQFLPNPSDFDNARYLLYECSGGYPIGIFAMYVRSSIAQQDERGPTQLFLVVGFNFYGNEELGDSHLINKTWEKIHNRVTANFMNRFKQLCEWRFTQLQQGLQDAYETHEGGQD